MVKKVTYSRKPDKRRFPADFDLDDQSDNSRKKARPDARSKHESRPSTALANHKGKRSSLLKQCAFAGPVSIPDADMDFDTRPKSASRPSVFGKVIKQGRYQAAKPDEGSIRSNREDFVDMMNGHRRNSQLPTPPAESQKKAYQQMQKDEAFSRPSAYTHRRELRLINSPTPPTPPTPTSQLFGRIVTNEQPKEPYRPKTYKAEQLRAPRRTITGHGLSTKSRQSHL